MRKLGLAPLVALPVSFLAFSQTVTASAQFPTTASSPSGQTSPQPSTQTITLGNFAVALNGPCSSSPATHRSSIARPSRPTAFDDAHWAPMDLAPQAGAADLV
jgi:hypothetical protein